ncbi:MAG: dihydrolipoyl dehydrogenase [Pseudomonadota bacterium]
MATTSYDVVIIGAGPAGYVAAIRCAQLGLKTACIDEWVGENGQPSLGGTCLNVGCIPSKALLDSTHYYHHMIHQAKDHGITVKEAAIDVTAMQQRKSKIVGMLTRGIKGLFKKNGVARLVGTGRLMDDGKVKVMSKQGSGEAGQLLESRHVIIATGSHPVSLAQAPVDGSTIVDSSGALAFGEVPQRLAVIGAGVIGLELGSVWNRLGAKVTVLEALDTFLPTVDQALAKEALPVFKKQGLDIQLDARLTETKKTGSGVQVTYQTANRQRQIEVDKLVVAVGRRAYTEGLGVEAVGLALDERGFIVTDEHWRTNLDGVYAIGDVIGGPMLAHKGSEEGVALAERIAGQAGHVNYDTIPWVVYTWPEIAWVGRTEQQLHQEGVGYRTGVFPFMAIGRARAMGEVAGKVKIIGDEKTDRILGVHIFGPHASELISEAVVAMECDASTEDLARTIHAHPTLAEAMHEAALAVDNRAIHL